MKAMLATGVGLLGLICLPIGGSLFCGFVLGQTGVDPLLVPFKNLLGAVSVLFIVGSVVLLITANRLSKLDK